LQPGELTLDGRWTSKPFVLSRVQPIYLSVSRPSEVYINFIFKHVNTNGVKYQNIFLLIYCFSVKMRTLEYLVCTAPLLMCRHVLLSFYLP